MTDTKPTLIERQKETALAEARERNEEFRRVESIVLGDNDRRRRATEVVRLGDDYLVQIYGMGWTFVIDGKRGSSFHLTQEAAILHLIASRYDDNPNSNGNAALYAGRVLGLPVVDTES